MRKYGGLIAILLVVVVCTWGIYYWRHRLVQNNADLFHFLPREPGTTLFVDVKLLRRGGFLERYVAPARVVRDPDYEMFVRETGFDYTRDLDTLVGKIGSGKIGSVPNPSAALLDRSYFREVENGVENGSVPINQLGKLDSLRLTKTKIGSVPFSGVVLLGRGRFDWGKLRTYAVRHGASCEGSFCRDSNLAFRQIQSDVLQLFKGPVPISELPTGSVPVSKANSQLPDAPVWLKLGPNVLADPGGLPLPLRIFAISLGQASSVIFSLGPAAEASGAAFVLKFKATLPNAAAADTVRSQLDLQAKMLALALKRSHQKPDPASLTGLLLSGSFEASGTTVRGIWPVRPELLRALQ